MRTEYRDDPTVDTADLPVSYTHLDVYKRQGRSRTNVHRLCYMHFVRSLANMGGGEWHEKRKFHFAEM